MFVQVLSVLVVALGFLAWGPAPGRREQVVEAGRTSRPRQQVGPLDRVRVDDGVRAVASAWVAGRKESKLHLVPRGAVEDGAEPLAARCSHRLRGVIGAWSGRPPNIEGYAPCESCCVAEKAVPVLSGQAVPLDEALSTALGGHRPGRHAADRPTALIPRVVEEGATDRLPALRVIDAEQWPASDPDAAQRPGQPRHALDPRARAA